jgi:hypothetical protein
MIGFNSDGALSKYLVSHSSILRIIECVLLMDEVKSLLQTLIVKTGKSVIL